MNRDERQAATIDEERDICPDCGEHVATHAYKCPWCECQLVEPDEEDDHCICSEDYCRC